MLPIPLGDDAHPIKCSIQTKTVFILSAGASWHYGYPTGEELVKKVIAKARIAANHFTTALTSPANGIPFRPKYITRNSPDPVPADGLTGMKAEWQTAIGECSDLVSRLTTVDPLVIDYFLGQNPRLGDIGKFFIAWVLLESESVFLKYGINNNRRELLLRTSDRMDREKASSIEHLRHHNDNWRRLAADHAEQEPAAAAVKTWLLAQIDKKRPAPSTDPMETAPDQPFAPERLPA